MDQLSVFLLFFVFFLGGGWWLGNPLELHTLKSEPRSTWVVLEIRLHFSLYCFFRFSLFSFSFVYFFEYMFVLGGSMGKAAEILHGGTLPCKMPSRVP